MHAGQGDGRDRERGDRGDPLGRGDSEAERPHGTERGADDRDPLEFESVQQRGELRHRMLAQGSPRVVERVAEAESGQIEGDQTMTREVRHERRPGRRRHAAAVHEQQRRTLARLEHAHRERRVRQADPPSGDLHPTGGEELALGLLERLR